MAIFGYMLTLVYILMLAGFILSLFLFRKDIRKAIGKKITKNSLIALFFILLFFVIFLAMFVHPLEQLYFDENIYQGIAMNILKNGNAFWCQYGSAYLNQCGASTVYHDPVEWSFYIALAFAVFGIGTSTAYGIQMAAGVLLIISVFLLASSMKGSRAGTLAALAIAIMPEVLIWSRAQAVPDLAFAAFATLSFFFFTLFAENKRSSLLIPFLLSLGIAIYMRTEGFLLLPLFLVLFFIYGKGPVRQNFAEAVKWLSALVNADERSMFSLVMFLLLLIPQAYYISGQLASPQFGQGSTGLFSIANFKNNAPTNIDYLLGNFNNTSFYPAAFPAEATILAVIGIAVLIVAGVRRNNNFAIIGLLGLWFLAYFLFYAFFYAGGATYGVDSRMMLQTHPQIAIFSAIGIVEIAGFLGAVRKSKKEKRSRKIASSRKIRKALMYVAYAAFITVMAYVFLIFLPQTTMLPGNAPQQSVILPATNFIESNYSVVPADCLVFSFTPDIWYEAGRPSAQIGYLSSTNQSFMSFEKSYRCFVLDYGYWCLVPPFHSSTCATDSNRYNVSVLGTSSIGNSGYNASFLLLRNYST